MGWMHDEEGLQKCTANYTPLTPLSHLARAAVVFPDVLAVVYGTYRATYADYHARCSRLASALVGKGVKPGDVVATLIPNLPAQAEAHFGVPACGAVLNTINTRLDVDTVTYIFDHGGARLCLSIRSFSIWPKPPCARTDGTGSADHRSARSGCGLSGVWAVSETYEDLLAGGDAGFKWIMPEDEWESLALNYTSGTTGRPKGVVYHHRGAYLMTMGTVISWRMVLHPVFMAIVPLFHCNGWNHTWMMPLIGGTLVCCRDITATAIYNAIADEGVSHFGGAPIVLNMIVNAPEGDRRAFDHTVEVFTAGAPPAPATLSKIETLGFNVTQVYGLTETYGHVTECIWRRDWDGLDNSARAAVKARQGVALPMMEDITVLDEQMAQVADDGQTQGEIMIRGNSVMKGYLKNPRGHGRSLCGWLFPFRRSGGSAPGWLHPDRRSGQRHYHLRR